MRRLLLTAKWFALQAQANEIQIAHFQQALSQLELSDSQAQSKLQNLFQAQAIAWPETATPIDIPDLETIANQPRIPYQPAFHQIVLQMEEANFGLSSVISSPVMPQSTSGKHQQTLSVVAEVKALLSSKVFDQDSAVEAVSDAVMQMSWQELSNRPRASFFFLGPPATGKTYLAQLLGQGLQGYAFKAFDMTQFSSEEESFGLVGLRKGYQNAGAGALTEFVKKNPKSILVFDEIEKTHTKVQASLLRLFSAGFLQDEFLQEDIDFRQTLVVFTSNLGSELYSNRSFVDQLTQQPQQARESLLEVIRREKKLERGHEVSAISPEMLSRVSQGSIILFNRLSLNGLTRIAEAQIQKEAAAFQKAMGLKIHLPNLRQLAQMVVLGFAPSFDVRALKARTADLIIDPITDYLLANPTTAAATIEIRLVADLVAFLENTALEPLIKQLTHKHQRLQTDFNVLVEQDTLVLSFSNPTIEKLARGADFGDASGIQVDLPDVSFADIAGHDIIKGRLAEVISQIHQSEKLKSLGVNLPKGMLLFGPPGTGKTLLAKAFSNEAGLPFIACSGNDLLTEGFIKKLFARAREYAPALIFIDEIDALPKRGEAGAYADALVNRLLVELDGFSKNGEDIFVMAATNRKDKIDSAILRSGRIDLHLEVPHLDKGARLWFLNKLLKQPSFSPDINIERLLTFTAGLSGADMQKIHRESVLESLRQQVEIIPESLVLEQINTLKYGQPLSLAESDQRLKETAYHEAGHAVISMVLLPERKIEQLTVVPRSNALGMVSFDIEETMDYHKETLFNLTCVALAGRIAQVQATGAKGLDSGASGDLKQAMRYAYLAIAEWGMSNNLPNISLAALAQQTQQDWFVKETETEIRQWMADATQKTQTLVEQYMPAIEAITQDVLKQETLDATQLQNHLQQSQN